MTPHEKDIMTRIDRRGRLHSIGFVVVIVWLTVLTVAAFGQSNETFAAARADRAQFAQAEHGYLYYVTTENLPPAKQLTAGRTAAFAITSFSTAVVLEHHMPIEVAHGLWRIDLRELDWRWQDLHTVLKGYPYYPPNNPPLVIRADWLTQELVDCFESQSGFQLLYKGKPPKTLKEFQDFWKVQASDPDLALFHVEQESGVSLLGIRLLGNEDAPNRRRYFHTQDNAKRNFNAQTDPLETLLDAKRKHDASEHIVQFLKISAAQGIGGTAQQYLLANGDGVRQDRAPTDVVEDHERSRGKAEIVNGLSCMVCHHEGIKSPTKNNLREIIAAGVDLYSDKASQRLLDQQFLADAQWKIDVQRSQEDYETYVSLVTGWSAAENARALKSLIADYDAPVNLETAARELYVTPKELTLALGYASARNAKLGARLASLPHGGVVERHYFESVFPTAFAAVELWRQAAP